MEDSGDEEHAPSAVETFSHTTAPPSLDGIQLSAIEVLPPCLASATSMNARTVLKRSSVVLPCGWKSHAPRSEGACEAAFAPASASAALLCGL